MRLFLSHAWRADCLGRDTHARVRTLNRALRRRGVDTWFDEDEMHGDIDAAMALGLEGSDVVVVLLTRAYADKVATAALDPRARDNCYKECSFACTNTKVCLPVVFEPCMRDVSSWPSVVRLYFGSKLYVDGVGDDPDALADAVLRMMRRSGIKDAPRVAPLPRRSVRAMPRPPTRVAPLLRRRCLRPPRRQAPVLGRPPVATVFL